MNDKYDWLRHRQYIVIDETKESGYHWRNLIIIIVSIFICLHWSGWRLFLLLVSWLLISNCDYILDLIEELQLTRLVNFKSLMMRFWVLIQVKTLLNNELGHISSFYHFAINNRIRIPFINVFIAQTAQTFDGDVTIEMLPEFTELLTDPHFAQQMTANFRNVTQQLCVSAVRVAANGNHLCFKLMNTNLEMQYQFSNSNDLLVSDCYQIMIDKQHYFDWRNAYHCIVSGVTGAGKSTLMMYMILNVIKDRKWQITIIDPKQSELSQITSNKRVCVAYQKEDIMTLLTQTIIDMQHQARIFHDNRQSQLPPHLIVVDELAALKAMVDRKTNKEIDDDLKQIALLGRQLNFHLLIGIQQANAQNIATEIREQMGVRILLGNSNSESQRFLFNGNTMNVYNQQIGTGLLSINNSEPVLIKAPLIKFDLVSAINQLLLNEG